MRIDPSVSRLVGAPNPAPPTTRETSAFETVKAAPSLPDMTGQTSITTPAGLIEVAPARRMAVVPFNPTLANVVPVSKEIIWRGQRSLAVPHTADVTRFARNMGIDLPAPIFYHYHWPAEGGRKPFSAQRRTAALLTTNKRAYVLNSFGTGKTMSSLWAFDYLRSVGEAHKMLVVAPLSTLQRTWAAEIFKHLPHLKCAVLVGDRKKRLKLLDDRNVDVYVINHDGMSIISKELETRQDIDILNIDELAVYRNNSQRSKLMRVIAARFPRVWGMTGSPTPNEPTDAWMQVKIVTPHTCQESFGRFRDKTMLKINQFKYVPKPNAQQEVHRIMQPSVRFTLDEVNELPDVVYRTIEVPMGTKQAAAYKHLGKHMLAEFAAGRVDAANAGVLTNKLLQVSLGWVYTTDRAVVAFDNDARLDAVIESIEANERKVIVFVPYIHALEFTAARLKKEGITYEVVSGDTPAGERNNIFQRFQETSDPHVLVAHPQCMAHGLTLTAADTIIWLGPYASLEVFDQANARIRRISQQHRQQVLMLAGSPVEHRTYAALQRKQGVQNVLLDLFAEQDDPF